MDVGTPFVVDEPGAEVAVGTPAVDKPSNDAAAGNMSVDKLFYLVMLYRIPPMVFSISQYLSSLGGGGKFLSAFLNSFNITRLLRQAILCL